MEVTKFEIRKDGDTHIASYTVRLNPYTDKFNDKMEEFRDLVNKELADMHKIKPGDYFIARKPKDALGGLPWIDAMDKFDGVIQKCASIGVRGCVLSENTFMDTWWYDPSWCEKVSPGDVMKTDKGSLFIFKEMKDGKVYDHAFYNEFGYVVINDDEISDMPYSHATPEEAQELFDALAKGGKRWNAEKMQIEDIDPTWKKFTEDDLKNIGIMAAVNEIPNSNKDKHKELTESLANEGIVALNEMNKLFAEFNEFLPGLTAGIMRDISYSPGKRDALKQVIKLCKKFLNE